MAATGALEPSQGSVSRLTVIPPLTVDEEDQVILARITNDERPLKRVIKKFHNYTSLSHSPIVPAVSAEMTLDDAREAFLVELATFQLSLKKSTMICEAEARQVEEYQRERQQIEHEHEILRAQIEQLKLALEEAQMVRRRKIEYDLVAEKVNTLPSREELEHSIQVLESDMAAIRSEHDNQSRTLCDQKSSLDEIIAQLDFLRFMGKDKDIASVAPSRRTSPAPDNDGANAVEEALVATLVATEVINSEEKEEGEEDKATSEPPPTTMSETAEDDIEMGEVEEDPKNGKTKKKSRDELEEGEASDASSALSDPPDD